MKRKVRCCDGLKFVKTARGVKALITSLPDAREMDYPLNDYQTWFRDAAGLLMSAVARDGVAVFYQTDRRHEGTLLSKAALLCNTASSLGLRLLWHKIVLQSSVGSISLFRPSYTHMMAFSKLLRAGKPTPDVIEAGKKVYKNGMGINAASVAVRFAKHNAKTTTIYDPFCGQGTVLAVANALGLDSIGCDIDPSQCNQAKKVKLKLNG
ncbi:MAG: DNA methyltransferase [Pyrinomonadaceae bacterium]